jgi:BlaI family penicillinase repressor
MFLGSVSTVYELCSVPAKKRPAYTPMQTMVCRLEVKKALRRIKKIATALIFEAASSREADLGR